MNLNLTPAPPEEEKATRAIRLIAELARAAIDCYRVTNKRTRLSPAKAKRREDNAAQRLFVDLVGREATEDELSRML